MVSNHEYDRVCKKLCEAESENIRLKRQIEAYVCEFRVCRMCKHLHNDCTPTDGECHPKWGGLA